MNNLYTTYTKDEIQIFKELSSMKDKFSPTSKLIDISSKITIFKDIPKTILIKILTNITIKKYKQGEVIIQEGDLGSTMYYVLLGKVNVFKNEILITTLDNNTIIGEMASLLHQKRSASIISATNATTIIEFNIDFGLLHTELGYYFAIIYKNLSVELAKKILQQDNQIVKK